MKKNLTSSLMAIGVVFTLTSFVALSTVDSALLGNKATAISAPVTAAVPTKSLYDFTMTSLDGKPVALKAYKGKKVVILNVASKCGFTPQYADWEKFYKEHGDKIVVLGFPANNFKEQESGTNQEIAEFCKKNYGVTFPMFEKVSVLGADQAPLYQWLTKKEMNGWNEQAPTWNFCKYVVNEKGELTNFFPSKVKPDNEEFKKAVGI